MQKQDAEAAAAAAAGAPKITSELRGAAQQTSTIMASLV